MIDRETYTTSNTYVPISSNVVSASSTNPSNIVRSASTIPMDPLDGYINSHMFVDENAFSNEMEIRHPYFETYVNKKMEEFATKIYNVLKELNRIEISKEEWLKLLKEESE